MALENCPVNARGLMSGILQQGYSIGYVLAACANLGVGGSTNSWKKVFWAGAGVSIGVGFIRMLFPESKQFIEAKKAGHKAKAPGLFWAETKKMLRQEWRMCIYCIILMTWVSNLGNTSANSDTDDRRVVQLLLPHQPRQLHHLHAHPKTPLQLPRNPRLHPHENRRLRRRHHNRVPLSILRPPPHNHRLSPHVRPHDPSLDSPRRRARALGYRLLHPILRARCLGRDSYPPERTLTPSFQEFFPGDNVSAR